MEKSFHISEIANFFQIPASTLRYWDETGILSPQKDPLNSYRTYTVSDLMTISDILFYKNLGLSLKQIRVMEQMTPMEHEHLLMKKVHDMEYQKQEIEYRIQRLNCHLTAIKSLQQLKASPFFQTNIDSDCIVPFELVEADKLHQYISNPYLYSRVQHSKNLEQEQRGLTLTMEQAANYADTQKLWKNNGSRYIACLMKEEIAENFPNNLLTLLAHVQKNCQTGYIISRFLLCASEDGKVYDFYKTYIEILQ